MGPFKFKQFIIYLIKPGRLRAAFTIFIIMEEVYEVEKTFDKIDFSQSPFPKGEYEECRFINCDLSNADLSGSSFSECSFLGCNLNMANLVKTAFTDVKFRDSKMLGLQFGNCNPFRFAVDFENCILNHSSFYNTKLKKALFKNSNLHEVDFTSCDLSEATFDNCDLALATFQSAILEKANFLTAYNYSIDPEMNKIKKARFSQMGIAGLLDKYDIEIEG